MEPTGSKTKMEEALKEQVAGKVQEGADHLEGTGSSQERLDGDEVNPAKDRARGRNKRRIWRGG